ncbi:MAG: EamA family transporter RarD, partial [Brevundimonas sp.]
MEKPMTTAAGSDSSRPALLSAFGCYVMWGLMPLLFMGQHAIGFDAFEILAHRALWAVGVAGLLVLLAKQGGQVLAVFRSPRTLAWLMLSTVLIAVNWGLYVWATTHHATLEASLGYYINPLLNMVVGLWLFREKIDRWGWVAIGLAAVGVVFQALALGRPPWISIALAISFASYGVIRKRVPIEAQAGLFIECLLLAPLGLVWMLWLVHTGAAAGFESPINLLWALANGPATVLPLALFAWSARRLPLSTIGFIQFLAPTLQFAVGVWAGEQLTGLRIASFAFIWTGA